MQFYKTAVVPCFLIGVLAIGCSIGEGSLTVTTYPVSGSVIVDGKPGGKAPVALTLKSGKHEIKFSDYSDQFETPGTRVIRVNAGQQHNLTALYRNRFLAVNIPNGFSPPDSLLLFGTADHPLKDGTIFDYIDGGGLVYLKYGLTETTHAVYRDGRSNEITVDIFNMGTPEGARAIFNDEEVCPDGFEPCSAGAECKAYHYEPDFLLYFHRAKYFISVSTNNDSLQTAVTTLGTELTGNIP
ncbi:PEGA domain-containing protein [bacterium]|nr:PEGA domain-containing protein [bacterium]